MGERRCNERNIPLTVTQMLDDSGIGTSLRELKEESGLPCRPLDGNLKEKKKYNVSFQLADSTNCVSAVEKGTEQKSSQLLTSESLFETPPNSLLENVPIPVLSKVAELEVSGKLGSRTQSEENSIQEENLSEATLTSSSLNERDPPADKSKESHKVVQNVAQCPNKELSDLSSTVTDQEKYNPKIPVSEWCADKNREAKSSSDQQNCYNEGKNLPPEEWTPCKSAKQHTGDGSPAKVAAKNSPLVAGRRISDRKNYSFEEIVEMLGDKMRGLLLKTSFCGTETRSDLKFIQRQTRYSSDVILNRRIVDRIVKMGVAHVYLKVWQSVSNVDYLVVDNLIVFKNLQYVLSIIWNTSDKSAALCETLVKCGVVQLQIEELQSEKLRGGYKDENTLYLIKAYLGILHNMARLCPDSRKIFRSSRAVDVLKTYLSSEIGLVKTKAYLILSYIITEEENSIINATHDLLHYIIGILREALSSENHFAKTTAFWATEIADGLNHLAVNDANKVRLGQLGAIQLYLKLLQSDSIEEQSLGTAGIWILAFSDENKYLISKVHGCMEALQILASKSPLESIRRSARGALWVIKKAPERPTVQQVKDTDVPHVMISYQWAAQSTMIRVKNQLKAAGYKVWLDIDNMSGSTLEAMALAVERAAVVLICMSQLFKDSASCRTEAEYTYSQRKEIIPLLLQQGYVPDGWLGALVGTKVFFDMTDEDNFHVQVERLIREIGSRGRLGSKKTSGVTGGESERSHGRGDSLCSDLSLSSTSSFHSYKRQPSALSWSPSEVQQWLSSQQLDHVADRFEGFTGELLLQYKLVMKTAPEYFYSSLDTKLKLDLVSSLKFSKALSNLAGNP